MVTKGWNEWSLRTTALIASASALVDSKEFDSARGAMGRITAMRLPWRDRGVLTMIPDPLDHGQIALQKLSA